MSDVTIDVQLKCVAREIALRRNVYRRRIEQGAMKPEEAQREITAMEAVYQSLLLLQAPRPELKDTYPVVLYFASEADRQGFKEAAIEAHPGLAAKSL